jgi:hypothetical protein
VAKAREQAVPVVPAMVLQLVQKAWTVEIPAVAEAASQADNQVVGAKAARAECNNSLLLIHHWTSRAAGRFQLIAMKDDHKKENPANENYPRPERSDKQFNQEEFIQKQSNRKDDDLKKTPEETRSGGNGDTIGNP